MPDHRIVLIRFHNKHDPLHHYYRSFSVAGVNLECDDVWRHVAAYIGDQASDPIHATLFGIIEDVVMQPCDLPLGDRMNGIQFIPVLFPVGDPDAEWIGAESFSVGENIVGRPFAKHYLVPSD